MARVIGSSFRFLALVLCLNLNWETGPLAAPKIAEKAEVKSSEMLFEGSWKFYKMLYRDQLLDPINPNFHMFFTFLDEKHNSIVYYRDEETGFCERQALYHFDPVTKVLYQKVIWLNPLNAAYCAKDPDMTFESESWSGFGVLNGDLALQVPLSDETLTLLWRPSEAPVVPRKRSSTSP